VKNLVLFVLLVAIAYLIYQNRQQKASLDTLQQQNADLTAQLQQSAQKPGAAPVVHAPLGIVHSPLSAPGSYQGNPLDRPAFQDNGSNH
jgi:hypothetical protein